MGEVKHTALPWKVVSAPHFDSGLVYTSVQPVNVDEEGMKPLAMANGEFHVCRMSHTAAPWRFNYHRVNAAFIVEACNSYYETKAALAAKDADIAALQLRLTAVENSVRVGADVDHERDFLAMEARRYASHYPEASDGRNTFVMFAEMIEARAALAKEPTP